MKTRHNHILTFWCSLFSIAPEFCHSQGGTASLPRCHVHAEKTNVFLVLCCPLLATSGTALMHSCSTPTIPAEGWLKDQIISLPPHLILNYRTHMDIVVSLLRSLRVGVARVQHACHNQGLVVFLVASPGPSNQKLIHSRRAAEWTL